MEPIGRGVFLWFSWDEINVGEYDPLDSGFRREKRDSAK
jgi:hypothetical protein